MGEVGGFVMLEGGSEAAGAGEGGEVGAAPENEEGAVHALDEGGEGEGGGGVEVDGVDVGATGEEGAEVGSEGFDGVAGGLPGGGVGGCIGGGFDAGQSVAFAVEEPVSQGEVFVEVGEGGGLHEAVAGGDHPALIGERGRLALAIEGEEVEAAGSVLEIPEGDEAEVGGELCVGEGYPGDLVDGIGLADGVHHLTGEEGEASGEVVVEGMGGGGVLEEGADGLGMALSGGGVVMGGDFEAVAGGIGFAFGDDGFEEVIAVFDGFPEACGGGEVTVAKGIEGAGEGLRGEGANGVEGEHLQDGI